MATYMTGALQTGTGLDNTGADTGTVVLTQTGVVSFDDTLVQDLTFVLPANAQIIDFNVDALTGYDSATSATLSAGTTSGGTEYLNGINVKTTGRKSNGYSAAQLAAIADIGTDTDVVVTVTSVGQPTAGNVRVTLLYVQN